MYVIYAQMLLIIPMIKSPTTITSKPLQMALDHDRRLLRSLEMVNSRTAARVLPAEPSKPASM